LPLSHPPSFPTRRSSDLTPTNTSIPTPTSTPGAGVLAQMVSPVPGSLLSSSTVTFTWTSGAGVSQYWLWVSMVPGGGDIYTQSRSAELSPVVQSRSDVVC